MALILYIKKSKKFLKSLILLFNSFKMLTLTIVEKKAGYFGIGVPKYP